MPTHLPFGDANPVYQIVDAGQSTLSRDARGLVRPTDIASFANATDGSDIGAVEFKLNQAPTLEKGRDERISQSIVRITQSWGKDADAGDTLTYAHTGADVLPGDVAVSNAGIVSGTPNATGTFNFNVTVTDRAGRNSHGAL